MLTLAGRVGEETNTIAQPVTGSAPTLAGRGGVAGSAPTCGVGGSSGLAGVDKGWQGGGVGVSVISPRGFKFGTGVLCCTAQPRAKPPKRTGGGRAGGNTKQQADYHKTASRYKPPGRARRKENARRRCTGCAAVSTGRNERTS